MGAELPKDDPIVESFPDGPHDESEKLVDIVVITPASAFLARKPALCP